MQIEEALAQFLLQLDADGRSPHTRAQYERHVRLLARWYGGPIEEVTHQDLARFLVSSEARLRPDGKPKKATAANALRGSIRCFFGYLATSGVLPRDPARLVRRARCAPPPPRGLSPEDQERLLDVLSQATDPEERRDLVLFTTMLRTGIRVGSAVALDAVDLDLGGGELHLRTTKGNRPARVLVPREVAELLRRYLDGRTAGPMFPGRHGERLTTRHVARRFKGWLPRAGINRAASPHSLRHSFATSLMACTGSIALVQAALNHASPASTACYARVSQDLLREALGA